MEDGSGTKKTKTNDPNAARFLRKQYQKQGVDEQQEIQEANFRHDPSQSINKFAKKQTQRTLEKQVEYFGYAIQPFHMRNQQDIGDVDQEGFFVFKQRRNKSRDAWLDSVGELEDAQVADRLAKKIKTQSRFNSVYQGNSKLNENLRGEESQAQQEQRSQNQEQESQKMQKQEVQNEKMSLDELVELMISFLPSPKINANNYMKKLKSQKKMEEYNQLLTLSNQYIQKSGQYDILTKKKFQLQEILQEMRKKKANNIDEHSQELNWDVESEKQDKCQGIDIKQKNVDCKSDNDDDIF